MKKNIFRLVVALAVIPLLGFSCEGWLTWSFEATQEVVVGPFNLGSSPVSMSATVDLKDNEEYQKHNFDIIKSASITGLALEIVEASSGITDWSFVESASITLEADGIGEIIIESFEVVGDQLVFDVETTNIKPFLEADEVTMVLEFVSNVSSGEVTFKAIVSYKVVVSLLK